MADVDESFLFVLKNLLKAKRQTNQLDSQFLKEKNSRNRQIVEMRRLYRQSMNERYLFLKTLTEAFIFQKRSKPFNFWDRVKSKLTFNQWLKYFKMGKDTFNLLIEKLAPHLNPHEISFVSSEKQIAIALLSLSSGKKNKSIARLFSVSKSDVSSIIENVCIAITKLMPEYIKVPECESVKDSVKAFEEKWGFPQTAGVLGSIHIPLRTTNLPENATDYINSDNTYSMLLQGIVEASYKFWDINVGWPGSVPESRVFTSSNLWLKGQDRTLFPDDHKKLSNIDVPLLILAGSSYPLSHWVLRPFLTEPLSKEEKAFNEKFTFAYNACEIAFKRLKARWNCLVIGNICTIDVFPTVIAACCILHNICEEQKEIIFDEWIIKTENHYKQPIPYPCNAVIGPQAETIRQAVKEYFVSMDA